MVREVSLMSLEALRRRRTSHAKLWFQRAQAEASTEQQEDGKEATEESCRPLKGGHRGVLQTPERSLVFL